MIQTFKVYVIQDSIDYNMIHICVKIKVIGEVNLFVIVTKILYIYYKSKYKCGYTRFIIYEIKILFDYAYIYIYILICRRELRLDGTTIFTSRSKVLHFL